MNESERRKREKRVLERLVKKYNYITRESDAYLRYYAWGWSCDYEDGSIESVKHDIEEYIDQFLDCMYIPPIGNNEESEEKG